MLILALPLAAYSQRHSSQGVISPSAYADAVHQGRQSIEALMEITRIPGLSVAVSINGAVVWSEGFGYADLEHRVPVTELTRFRLASTSKVLTIAALARLRDEGHLDLDAPIEQYLPSFPDKGHPITSRHLAGHLAGIRGYQDKDYSETQNIDFEHYDSVSEALAIFQDDPLVAPPGTRYTYSVFGYTLLRAVIEAIAAQDFLSYLQDHIFSPLGMRHTGADYRDQIVPHRTAYYSWNSEGRLGHAAYVDPSYKWAGGGLLATAEDLDTLRMGGRVDTGTLVLTGEAYPHEGWITTPASLSHRAERFGLPVAARSPVVNVTVEGDNVRLVVVSPLGLHPLHLQHTEDGFEGYLVTLQGHRLQVIQNKVEGTRETGP